MLDHMAMADIQPSGASLVQGVTCKNHDRKLPKDSSVSLNKHPLSSKAVGYLTTLRLINVLKYCPDPA